jgi:hypothetical protein
MSPPFVVDNCPVCVHRQRQEIEHDLCFNPNLDANDVAAKCGIREVALSAAQEEAGGAHRGLLATAGEHVRRHRAHFTPTRPTG